MLNLGAQVVTLEEYGEAYEIENVNLDSQVQFVEGWWKAMPFDAPLDVIASTSAPQTRRPLERLRRNEADTVDVHKAQR